MNKLLDPPPGIVEAVVRYECPKCGNNCQCGVPYIAKTVRAAEYAAKNPTASVREIAKQTGVGHGTAQEAKARVRGRTPDTVTGRDGKSCPATATVSRKLPEPEIEPISDEDITLIGEIMATYELLTPAGRREAARRIAQRHDDVHGEVLF